MKLPDAICIRPLNAPVHARISVPGSKSLTNRALILAALDRGATRLLGALWSEDTERMVDCLQRLGFQLEVAADPANTDNRTITVHGRGGEIPATEADLFVGTAGTVARFLTAFCALGRGRYRLHGTPRMHERPMKDGFDSIRVLGAKVEDTDGHLPAIITGPIRPGRVTVSETDSSQFASGLLLIGRVARITVETAASPYVEMTRRLLAEWDIPSAARAIEPDASSASYFWALRHLHGGSLEIDRWPEQSSQIDQRMQNFLPPPATISRKSDLGDSVLTLTVLAAAMRRPFQLVEAANLRKQESDRLTVLAAELRRCGVPVEEQSDGITLAPATDFRRARIRTWQDHRIAMSFAVLATVDALGDGRPWLTIEDPGCVGKTFPGFFETWEAVARQSAASRGKAFCPCILHPDGLPVFTV